MAKAIDDAEKRIEVIQSKIDKLDADRIKLQGERDAEKAKILEAVQEVSAKYGSAAPTMRLTRSRGKFDAEKVVAYVRENGPVSARQIATPDVAGVSYPTALKEMKGLVKDGTLVTQGSKYALPG